MWVIVALKIMAGGAAVPLPLAIGPDLLFAGQAGCAKAAKMYAPVAVKAKLGLVCRFYPVFGGKKAEAF